MRPLIVPSTVLAAAALVGAALAGVSTRSPERAGIRASGAPFYAPPSDLADALATLPRSPASGATAPPLLQTPPRLDEAVPPEPREFFFTRAVYSGSRGGWGGFGRGSWSTDYPKADRQFLVVLRRLTNLDAYPRENAVRLSDPGIRRFPFLYALEVGYMRLDDEEIRGLRDYLAAGGFLVIDDFWGTRQWANFEYQMSQVLPGRPIEDLPLEHPLFHAFYDIDEIVQVPNVRQGMSGGPTHERDGFVPRVRGIFDDDGRLVVVINHNTDLGDAWEWAENPYYPLEYSTFAYEMGVNMIVYGMSH